jgi:hypothetical protein
MKGLVGKPEAEKLIGISARHFGKIILIRIIKE